MSDIDPFKPATTGYSPDKFYTNHGERSNESLNIRIKFDPVVFDQIMKLFVANESGFSDYRSIHDFIADAVTHRTSYLLREFEHLIDQDDETVRAWRTWLTKSHTGTVEHRRREQVATLAQLIDQLDRAASDEEYADPGALGKLIEQAKEHIAASNDREHAKLLYALKEAEGRLREVQSNYQMELSRAMESTFDPFAPES